MGTRHLIIVYYKGQYYIAQYGQWDGYPSGQGLDVLKFARDPELVAKLQAALDADMVYEPTDEEVEALQRKVDDMERELEEKRIVADSYNRYSSDEPRPINVVCPSLSRDTGAKILELVATATERVPIRKELDFISDGLFCEWAWVLDLDLRVLECWRGGSGHSGGNWELSTRFNNLEAIRVGRGTRPTLMASFALDELPDDRSFLEQCGEKPHRLK